MEPIFREYPSSTESISSQANLGYFISYINSLEGVKTKIKNLHWAAKSLPVNEHGKAHEILDDMLEGVSEFQDTVAETSQGIIEHMGVNVILGTSCSCSNIAELLKYTTDCTINFYNNLPKEIIFVGIKSETETFIKDLNKYKYLFELTE